MRNLLCWAAFILLLIPSTGAFAQQAEDDSTVEESSAAEATASETSETTESDTAESSESETTETAESDTAETSTDTASESGAPAAKGPQHFGFADFDATLSLGLGGLIYVTAEPGVDFGVLPLGDVATLSVGGTVNAGYCLLCAGLSALSNFSIGIWNITPQARGLFHINAIGDSIDSFGLDAFAGAAFGPAFYRFGVASNGVKLKSTMTSWLASIIAGARIFPSGFDTFFAFGELRYHFEFGFNDIVLRSDEWDAEFRFQTSYARRGLDLVLGGGLRF